MFTVRTRLRIVGLEFESRRSQEILLFPKMSRPDLGATQLTSQWVPSCLLGIKPPAYDVDHSLALAIALRLGMSGAVLLLSLYELMLWSGQGINT